MRKRENLILTSIIFAVLSVILIFLSKTNVGMFIRSVGEVIISPIQHTTFILYHNSVVARTDSKTKKTVETNLSDVKRVVDIASLERENKAFHDQFETTYPKNEKLLPVQIVGMPSFIPGISIVTQLVIDRGKDAGLKIGQVVIYQDNVVGKIIEVTQKNAVVETIFDASFTTAMKTMKTNALGIIKGTGKESLLVDNVVLSDQLIDGDVVATAGDIDQNGIGFPPDLVLGKIVSVNKKASDLFQQAIVTSLLDFHQLSTVFIYMP